MPLAIAPKDLDQVFERVAENIADLMNSTVKPGIAKEINNSAGKLVNIVKVKLEACALAKQEPNIPQIGKYKK